MIAVIIIVGFLKVKLILDWAKFKDYYFPSRTITHIFNFFIGIFRGLEISSDFFRKKQFKIIAIQWISNKFCVL